MQKPQKTAKTLNKQTNKIIKKRFSQISRLNDTNENTVRCDYYDLNDFNKVIVIKQDLAVLHLNMSSLSSHHNELKLLLLSKNLNFGIICIKERQRFTKELLKSSLPTSNIHIPGYSNEQTPTQSSAGGSLIYISQNLITKTDLTSKYITLNIWNPPSYFYFWKIIS